MNPHKPKIVAFQHIAARRGEWTDAGRTIVATNGCFDVLHVGHVRYLQAAKRLGDFLWVGVNDDASVRELKGEGRPVNEASDRAELIAALDCVDAVTVFSGVRATGFLEAVKPHVYVKGGDYTLQTLDPEEKHALERMKARVEIIQLVPGKSTTATLRKIRQR
jgi:rfaE bifunctional protein nucleotidyltransferase chain/domain